MNKFNNGQPDETLADFIASEPQLGPIDINEAHTDFLMTTQVRQALKGKVGFSIALTALKMGARITREGWNGKGMYLYLVGEGRYKPTTKTGHRIAAQHEDYLVPYQAYVAMFTVDKTVVPWLCSQSDLLANDWLILD